MLVDELSEEWSKSGIECGDTLLLHSSLKRTLKKYLRKKKEISTELVLESFLNVLGSDGTLLFPLFNFDFTKGVHFNHKTTVSHMGGLSEAARLYPGSVRTGHPVYSFAAIGLKAEEFKGIDNFSGYGADSPFSKLCELDGKIAVLNLPDQTSMTFYHYVEEMNEVSYRYHKKFTGDYTNASGLTVKKSYGIYVRNLEKGVVTNVNSLGELLWKEGLYTGEHYNEGSGLRVASANDVYDFVTEIIQSGRAKGLLYSIEGESYE